MTEDKPQHLFKKRLHQRCLIMSQYASAFLSLFSFQKQPPQVFYKKDVLKKFAIFTRNHLYWNLFFKKLFNKTPLLKNIFKRPLLSLPCLQTCLLSLHCVKSVQIRWSVFSRIRTEY